MKEAISDMNLIDSHKSPEESENLSKVVLLWGKNVLLCLHKQPTFPYSTFQTKKPNFSKIENIKIILKVNLLINVTDIFDALIKISF